MHTPLKSHLVSGIGNPEARQLNRTDSPTSAMTLSGCKVTAGLAAKVRQQIIMQSMKNLTYVTVDRV